MENALQIWFLGVVDLAILGPIAVHVDGDAVNLGGPKQRAVLALLLLRANETVSRDRLIEGLWGERAPPTAGRSLDSYVSRLRAMLGADRIARRPPGYAIRVEPGELDLERFEDLLEQGRRSLAAGDPATASHRVDQALALWRGPPLADLLDEPFAGVEAARLEERRLAALETKVDAELENGRGGQLVGEIERLVDENPFRERFVGQLMEALYQAGRTRDALAGCQSARLRFSDELGLELSPQLRELEHRILIHDPSLGTPVKEPRRTATRERRGLLVAGTAAAIAVAATVAGLLLATRGVHASASRRLVELAPASNDPARLSDTSAAMATDDDSVWIAEPNAGAIVRIDQRSQDVVQRIPLDGAGAVAAGGGAVWAASVPGGTIVRIDPQTGARTQTIDLGGASVSALAYARGLVWVADVTDQVLMAVDAASGTVKRTLELLVKPTAVAVGARTIWIADYDQGIVTEIDSRGATLETIRVGNGPAAIAVGAGATWVANSLDSTVSKINPETGAIAATIPVGSYPVALAVDGRSAWVGNEYSSSVSRIDAQTGSISSTARLAGQPTALAATGGKLWVGTRAVERRRGGVLRLLKSVPFSIDPAINLDLGPLQVGGLTADGLLATNHASGQQGLALVPDLAVAIPLPTDHGLSYTFRLRPRIRYSNGGWVRASDFRRALERLFRARSPGRQYYANIRGAAACTAARCDLSRGVITDDAARTVTFHLTQPDPGFLRNLSGGGPASPVPVGTPWHAVRTTPIPGTGPYRIVSASGHEIRYERNPFFREWSHAAQPEGNPASIVWRFGLTPTQEVRAIEGNEADWTSDGIPAALLREVTTRYASRVHSYATTETEFLQLNATLRPFNDVRVRRALNYALDRRVVARLFGGPAAVSPACQVLPPGVLGYSPYCPYTRHPGKGRWTAPDLGEARRLVAASETHGAAITIWGTPNDSAVQHGVVSYIVRLLRELGYRARAHIVPGTFFETAPGNVFHTIQMTPPGWADGSAYGFFASWFACDAAYNHRWFCDPAVDHTIVHAQALEATDPRKAATEWAALDRLVTDRASWVPLVNPRLIDFLSARVGNYQHSPAGGLIADQLTVH